MELINFIPDWKDFWTAAEAEEQLKAIPGGFKFKGPGIYHHGDSTILALPSGDINELTKPVKGSEYPNTIWRQTSWPKDHKFIFCIWNSDPADVFNMIINAPTRT